jgi:hypothetical protein
MAYKVNVIVTFDLDPKFNRGHLEAKTNASMGCQVIGWKSFLCSRSMQPWPLSLLPQKKSSTAKDLCPYKFWWLMGSRLIGRKLLLLPWPLRRYPNIKSGHHDLLPKTKAPIKSDSHGSMSFWVISYGIKGQIMWSWPLNSNSKIKIKRSSTALDY